jgi:hypothetical protein
MKRNLMICQSEIINSPPPILENRIEKEPIVFTNDTKSDYEKKNLSGITKKELLKKSMIDKRFGALVVIDGPIKIESKSKWKRQNQWRCKCDCGKERTYITCMLNNGSAISCGCFTKKRVSNMNTKNVRPFEWAYNSLLRCAKSSKREVSLTFSDFLVFTKIDNCCYCGDKIEWKERRGKKDHHNAYYIDRKDNNTGYTKENCVVSCSLCNLTKHARFTYEEMLILGKSIGEIKKKRQIPR